MSRWRWTDVGTVTDANGDEVTVRVHDAGDVRLIGWEAGWEFDVSQRDKLRELLDRAAMPGQEGRRDDGKAAGAGVRDA